MIGLRNAKTRSLIWKDLGRTFLLIHLVAVLGIIPSVVEIRASFRRVLPTLEVVTLRFPL